LRSIFLFFLTKKPIFVRLYILRFKTTPFELICPVLRTREVNAMKRFKLILVAALLCYPLSESAAQADEYLYWTDSSANEIKRSRLDGSDVQTILKAQSPDPYQTALDLTAGHIYWTDVTLGSIRRSDLDGKNFETVISGITDPGGIAVDTEAGKVYWTDLTDGVIRRANLDGTGGETIISGQLTPNYLALHIQAGQIYWTDYSSEAGLQRANLDGTGVETIIEGPFLWGVALDIGASKIYIVSGSSGQGGIGRCDLDGTNRESLVWISIGWPRGIAVDPSGGKIYWADRIGSVDRADLDGSNEETIVQTYAGDDCHGVALDTASGKVYWTQQWGNLIGRANLDGTDEEQVVSPINPDPYDMVIDPAAEKFYWAKGRSGEIWSAELYGTRLERLVSGLIGIRGIDFDPVGNKLYWTAGSIVQRADLDGANIETLASGLGEPKGIEVYPAGGKVYWVDNDLGKIVRSDLDGANVTDIVTGLDSPEYIALDPIAKKIYWTLSSVAVPYKIQRANLDGSVVEYLPITGSILKGITMDIGAGKLYWSEWGSDKIRRANLDGSGIEDLVVSGLYAPQGLALTVSNPTTIIDDLNQAAVLQQNFPNPFNPVTTIPFTLPAQQFVSLTIYGVDGRKIVNLVDRIADKGYNACRWQGTDSHGIPVSSGVYFYRLKAGGKTLTKKMVLLK
jgi:DNA-binding beta-propeller fold protein YncE